MTPCRLSAFDPSDEVCGPILDAWAVASFIAHKVCLALVYVVCLAALMRDRQERIIPAPTPARRPRAARRGTVST